jgi:hypothetical protein
MTEYNSMTDKAPTVAVIGLGMLISKDRRYDRGNLQF